jgi:hypothetical protein
MKPSGRAQSVAEAIDGRASGENGANRRRPRPDTTGGRNRAFGKAECPVSLGEGRRTPSPADGVRGSLASGGTGDGSRQFPLCARRSSQRLPQGVEEDVGRGASVMKAISRRAALAVQASGCRKAWKEAGGRCKAAGAQAGVEAIGSRSASTVQAVGVAQGVVEAIDGRRPPSPAGGVGDGRRPAAQGAEEYLRHAPAPTGTSSIASDGLCPLWIARSSRAMTRDTPLACHEIHFPFSLQRSCIKKKSGVHYSQCINECGRMK